MTRSKKNPVGSRKQPTSRRSRNVNTRRKATMNSSSSGAARPIQASRKTDRLSSPELKNKKITSPAAGWSRSSSAEPSERKGSERGRAEKEPTQATPARRRDSTGPKSTRTTERPVARSLRPEPKQHETESKSGTSPLILGVGALLVGGLLWMGLSRESDSSKSTEAEQPPVAAAAVHEEKSPANSNAPAAAPAPEQVQPASDSAAEATPQEPVQDVAAEPVKRIRRNLLAAKAKPTPAVEEALPEPEKGPFDRGAAGGALTAAAQQASSCRQEGDPTGVAKVVVTFAPSGKVTAATINGPPFAGTKTGSCIAKTMRTMSIPPFEGDHMTISKTVVIM